MPTGYTRIDSCGGTTTTTEAIPGWYGERLDLGLAVDAMLDPER